MPAKQIIRGAGIYRISEDAGRRAKGKLHSDVNQQEAMLATAASNGIDLGLWFDETNVSGGTPLDKRPYGQAIAMVEAGDLDAILFAYRQRHDRDIIEGARAIQRMDRAGGILLVGGSILTHATPQKWFEASAGSLLGEYERRQIRWNIEKGVATAVAKGRMPGPATLLGLKLGPNNEVMRDDDNEQALRLVREMFELRDSGSTIDGCRLFLRDHGYEYSYRTVQRMLKSPLYIAQIRYGGTTRDDGSITPEYINDDLGFEPIVDPELWQRVQDRAGVYPGRWTKSERLLARQGVLLCGTCGARMIVVSKNSRGTTYFYYRCGQGRVGDCPAPATVSAPAIEEYVLDAAIREVKHIVEHESSTREARDAADDALAAERRVDDLEAKYMDLGPGKHPRALAKLDAARADAAARRAHADELAADQEEDWLGEADVLADTDPAALPAKRRILRALLAGRVRVAANESRAGRGDVPLAPRVSIAPRRKSRRAAAA